MQKSTKNEKISKFLNSPKLQLSLNIYIIGQIPIQKKVIPTWRQVHVKQATFGLIYQIWIIDYRPYHFPGLFVQKVIIELQKSKN